MTKNRVILFVVLIGAFWGDRNLAYANLLCTQSTFDLGLVHAGKPCSHSFSIKNLGKEVIQILEARPSCGCIHKPIIKSTLLPNESFSLAIEIHTLTKPPGQHSFAITLHYLEANQAKELILTVKADIKVEVEITPAASVIYTDRDHTHTLTIKDTRAKPLKIIAAETSNPNIDVQVSEPTINTNNESVQLITLHIKDSLNVNKHELWVVLTSDDPTYREMKVPLTVIKRDGKQTTASPGKLFLDSNLGTPIAAKIIRLTKSGPDAVMVQKVETSHPAFQCTWANGPGESATLRVLMDEKLLLKGETNTILTVYFKDAKEQKVQIPIFMLIK